MKKGIIWIMAALLLSGCAGDTEPVYETIGNVWENEEPVSAPASIEFAVPDGAEMEAVSTDSEVKIYRIGDWELWTQALDGGDLRATFEQLTGMDWDALTVVNHPVGEKNVYETAWTAMDEEDTYIIRAAVIEEGDYHYCLSLMALEDNSRTVGQFFTEILENVNLADTAA